MRMRRKPYARPELSACNFFVDRPCENMNTWKSLFVNPLAPFFVELGCGKGGFASQLASKNKNINFLVFDIKSEVLVSAKRNIEKAYCEAKIDIDNIFLTSHDIARINEVLSCNDKVDRIYINFCNPWPKSRHNKRRLTHTRQLNMYKGFLAKAGEIYFKTDDDTLFEESLDYFKECGFEFLYLTYDLHKDNNSWNIMTEHEKMFSEQGIKIKALIAKQSQE